MAGRADPGIAGRGRSPVFLAQAGKRRAVGGKQCRCIIGGAVVHHDEFEIGVALDEDRIDGLGEKTVPVMGGDDNGDRGGWRGHG